MQLYFAPVQGHTDAAYRHFHHKLYNLPNLIYFTPFIRLEKNEIRTKDLKDLTSPLNETIKLAPQIIFKNEEELKRLFVLITETGYKELDLNMGCPFPLQTARGRGAATLKNMELISAIPEIINNNPDFSFSAKIRLGMKENNEWEKLIEILNGTDLKFLTVHPRVARQQYNGETDLPEFKKIYDMCNKPLVYNGDIITPENYDNITAKFPKLSGVMIGRGALGRPSLFSEITEGKTWAREKRIEKMMKFHNELFTYYSENLCGDTQILSKIKPFWEYAENEIGRKAWKQISKATSIPKYNTAIGLIEL